MFISKYREGPPVTVLARLETIPITTNMVIILIEQMLCEC
jgi:hypothetical protein